MTGGVSDSDELSNVICFLLPQKIVAQELHPHSTHINSVIFKAFILVGLRVEGFRTDT